MRQRSHRRTLVLFGTLAAYIVLQFVWWAVLLLRKDREVVDLTLQLQALDIVPIAPLDAERRLRMVVGEGSVLLLLLLVVLLLTFRAIRRDLALARTQQNFLLAVTHELRSPIAAIKLQLQTLAREGLTVEQREQLRSHALEESDRLAHLTEKVLLATRAEEGPLELHLVETDVMELLREAVDRARQQMARDHVLTIAGPDRFMVRTDQQALRSIVDNLLENAAKYAPPGTRIDVAVVTGPEGWRLTVSDEGPGIAAEDQQRIFEKFHRGGNEETRRAKGTGLGLYIVQRLSGQMGGVVSVRSRSPHGSIFTASFPTR
jgi:signal transduction histidine kinase